MTFGINLATGQIASCPEIEKSESILMLWEVADVIKILYDDFLEQNIVK